jgi:rare lipoprotein A
MVIQASTERLDKVRLYGCNNLVALTATVDDPLTSSTAYCMKQISSGTIRQYLFSREGVTFLAEQYAGRHVRQARHGAWVNKKRSRVKPSRQILPVAAALTVAGLLIGGVGAVLQFSPRQNTDIDLAARYDVVDYPQPDHDAQAARASRDLSRPDAEPAGAAPTTVTQAPSPKATKTSTLGSGNGAVIATGSCAASFYDEPQGTASGETFNPNALTAAHKSLPFNTNVRVTNIANGKSVIVRINDRGPFIKGRCLDLSGAAFATIASLSRGVVDVRYEVLSADAG